MRTKPTKRKLPRSPELSLVPLSCPDCGGVLSVTQEGSKSPSLYICQIDHRHSATSFYRAMEERLENTLWTASVILKQLDKFYEELLAQQGRIGQPRTKSITRRLSEVRDQRAVIRALIEGTHVIESTT